MFKKITSFFTKETTTVNPEFYNIILEIITEIKDNTSATYFSTYDVKFSELKTYIKFKKKDISFKKDFSIWLISDIVRIYKRNRNLKSYDLKHESNVFSVEQTLLPLLFRTNLGFAESEYMYCINYFKNNKYTLGSIVLSK